MSLNSQQVLIIEADVKQASIALIELRQELVDHICCEVEERMANGRSFAESYEEVKQLFSIATLQSIEKNTMFLIDKNYARMKTSMKISGNISLVLIAFGTVLKILAITGANIILVIGFAVLCLGFIPSMFYTFRPTSGTNKNMVLKISAFAGSLAFATGILFRAMNWNSAGILIFVAYALILLVALPALLIHIQQNVIYKDNRRIVSFGVVSLMLFILSTLFKMFHLPGAAVLLLTGSIMLVSVFLPLYTYSEFKKSGMISGQFIFLVILSMYIVTMSLLMTFPAMPEIQHILSIR